MLAVRAPNPEAGSPVFVTKANKFVEKLNILQWNANAISTKQDELRIFLKEKSIDLFLIQETKLIEKDKKNPMKRNSRDIEY